MTSFADDAKPNDKRQLLSEHRTVAQFVAIKPQTCRGLTALCPDRCGHSGDFADFKIVAYLHYAKPGEYGDPKADTFTVQLSDNQGNLKLPKATVDAVRALKEGGFVLLDWNHDYVTRTEPGGGESKFPDRPIVKLQPVTKDEADNAMKAASK
jgi:hypothetical protein